MEGVIVLAEQAYYNYNVFTVLVAVFFIVFAFIGMLASVAIISNGIESNDPVGLLGGFLFVVSIFCGVFGFFCYDKAQESKTLNYIEQKVIIEDTINMNEFFEYYELLDQDGKIYIVRERPIE